MSKDYGFSGFLFPDSVSTLGKSLVDGSLVWEVITYNQDAPPWEINKKYYLSDEVNLPAYLEAMYVYNGEIAYNVSQNVYGQRRHAVDPGAPKYSYRVIKVSSVYPLTNDKSGVNVIDSKGVLDYYPPAYRDEPFFKMYSNLLDRIKHKYVKKRNKDLEDRLDFTSSKFNIKYAVDVVSKNPIVDVKDEEVSVKLTPPEKFYSLFPHLYPYRGHKDIFQFIFNMYGYKVTIRNYDEALLSGVHDDILTKTNQVLIDVHANNFHPKLEKVFKERLYAVAYIKTEFIFRYIYELSDRVINGIGYYQYSDVELEDEVEDVVNFVNYKSHSIDIKDITSSSIEYSQFTEVNLSDSIVTEVKSVVTTSRDIKYTDTVSSTIIYENGSTHTLIFKDCLQDPLFRFDGKIKHNADHLYGNLLETVPSFTIRKVNQ